LEQLSLIDEKRLTSVCHGQLYQKIMAPAYNKKVHLRYFEEGQLVLGCILPHQTEVKGKFSPNWKGPFILKKKEGIIQWCSLLKRYRRQNDRNGRQC